MRQQTSVAKVQVVHKAYIALLALLATVFLIGAPRAAEAQNDAVRILAERVLGTDGRWGDRGGVYDSRDRMDRERARDRARWEKEQRERERWCRKHRDDYRCDSWGFSQRRGSWCLDRNRDNRCDARRGDDRWDRGRGRDDDDDDRDWDRRGRRGRR